MKRAPIATAVQDTLTELDRLIAENACLRKSVALSRAENMDLVKAATKAMYALEALPANFATAEREALRALLTKHAG